MLESNPTFYSHLTSSLGHQGLLEPIPAIVGFTPGPKVHPFTVFSLNNKVTLQRNVSKRFDSKWSTCDLTQFIHFASSSPTIIGRVKSSDQSCWLSQHLKNKLVTNFISLVRVCLTSCFTVFAVSEKLFKAEIVIVISKTMTAKGRCKRGLTFTLSHLKTASKKHFILLFMQTLHKHLYSLKEKSKLTS